MKIGELSNMTDIDIKLLRPSSKMPKYETPASAGADLYACFILAEEEKNKESKPCVIIRPGETAFIPTGISVALPEGCVGLVYARSGLSCKKGLAPANKVGVIDPDYRGEIMVALHNHGDKIQTVYEGDRIAQFVITPYYRAHYHKVDNLSDTERGAGGFGSTGSN